jgi:hypothetical protein
MGPEGICGSLIDLGHADGCPGDPDATVVVSQPGDDLAICLFHRRTSDAQCTPPLHCVSGPVPSATVWAYL